MPKFKENKLPCAQNLEELSDKVLKLPNEHIQSLGSADWLEIMKKIIELAKLPKEQEKACNYKIEINNNNIEKAKRQIKYLNQKKEKIEKEISILLKKQQITEDKNKIEQQIKTKKDMVAKCLEEIDDEEKIIKQATTDIQLYEHKSLKKGIWSKEYLLSQYSEMFAKLYSNYRFPKDVTNFLTAMGKEIGERLASTNINTSEFALNIKSQRETQANIISKEVLEALFPNSSFFDEAIHRVELSKLDGKAGETYSDKILLTNSIKDNLIRTTVHEAIHAYAQVKPKTFSRFLRKEGVYPLSHNYLITPEIKSFYDVLIYNEILYGTRLDFNKLNGDGATQTYKNQPLERMANLVGTIAERTYRQITNQDYERNSVDLYNYTLPKIGALDSIAFDKEKKIVIHKYKATEKLTLDKVKDVFKDADELFKKELNIRQEGEFICYSVSNNWSFRSKLLNFMKKQKRKEAYQKASKEIMQQRAKQK